MGFITNHGYLDNPTFRGMRWHLLKTFDKIYVLDLHGNAKKKEVAPDGSPDKNVFDIMQGVAIIIGVKKMAADKPVKGKKPVKLAKVYHTEFWGNREGKYKNLWSGELYSNHWSELDIRGDQYRFNITNWELLKEYGKLFSLKDLFSPNGRPAPGIVTTHDQFAISWDRHETEMKIELLLSSDSEGNARTFFRLCSQDQWNYERAKKHLTTGEWRIDVSPVLYRPFDIRYTVYDNNVAVHLRTRMTSHFRKGENIGLVTSRMTKGENFAHALVTTNFSEAIVLSPKTSNNGFNFPLYLYPDEQDLDQTRRINFDPKLYKKLQNLATDPERGTPDELATFDYIYGVLHCPQYRETYREFLKIDFPRIPWPKTPKQFWDISDKGNQLCRLHLMEPDAIGETPYPFKGEGDAIVAKPLFAEGRVWINKDQYFDNVPKIAWEFYIGGYQPAQKWLKDRKTRELTFDDIRHYQRIIKILSETDRIMKTIKMEL